MGILELELNGSRAVAGDGDDAVDLALRELRLPVGHRVTEVGSVRELPGLEIGILGVVGDADLLQSGRREGNVHEGDLQESGTGTFVFTDPLATLGDILSSRDVRNELAEAGTKGGGIDNLEEVEVLGLFGETGAADVSVTQARCCEYRSSATYWMSPWMFTGSKAGADIVNKMMCLLSSL